MATYSSQHVCFRASVARWFCPPPCLWSTPTSRAKSAASHSPSGVPPLVEWWPLAPSSVAGSPRTTHGAGLSESTSLSASSSSLVRCSPFLNPRKTETTVASTGLVLCTPSSPCRPLSLVSSKVAPTVGGKSTSPSPWVTGPGLARYRSSL